MKQVIDLSADLQAWVRTGGLELTQGSRTDDGRALLWNTGGERRYFIGLAEGYYVITSSDRMGDEHFHLAALTSGLLEKYLYGHFGGSVRKSRGLPRIRKPFMRNEIKDGYTIGTTVLAGEERDGLIDSAGSMLAVAADDRLVELSHYIDASTDAIKNSFLDPEGKPLFARLSA
ncbi:TNT antitoxin family protein [Mycobacterium palustre]|uniref:TNT antitoxin family protein n=1 Tax=Mycobacterium palustre TaxID=153971 RepID=UPI000A15C8D0|nr:TNT antitoxin family protein [Mycobacterium palustre]MCV7100290.1 TNT antitoxin family protein [Mycobacterium palustre]